MKFPQDFIERVREATNIVTIISQYVQLRRTGNNYQGLCPFHGEKTPSFSVSEDKQVYYCFGCKASGNVYGFVQRYQGMTFPESVEYLAKRAGLTVPVSVHQEKGDPVRDLKQTLFKINSLAAHFYHDELLRLSPEHEVKIYLKDRGLSDELVRAYKLGYAPAGWTALTEHLASCRAPLSPTEQLGLIKRRGEGKNGHYDLFRHRLMFPIFSPTGQCLGFGGRVLSSEQQPKYLNSPDSPVFHKGKVFYGLDHAAKYIRAEDEVIVVEGYMDWLALAKYEIGNAVATLGTALTADHAHAIQRYTNRVLVLFDGDNPGKEAARRSLPILLAAGLHVRGLFLPDQLDPDEYLAERGAPALRQALQSAPDLFQLVSGEAWMQAKGSPTGKVQLLDEFAAILGLIEDPRLRRLYVESFSVMLGVDPRMVEQSVARSQSPQLARPKSDQRSDAPALASPIAPPAAAKIDLSKVPRAELEILNVILTSEVYLKEALESAVGEQMSHPGAKAVMQRIAEVYGLMPNKFDTLSALLADEVKPVEAITQHLSKPYTELNAEAAHKLLQDCIKRVKIQYLRMKSKELILSLPLSGEANPSEQLEQIMNIHKDRRSLNRDS